MKTKYISRKITAWVLTLAMVLTLIPAFPKTTKAEVWDGVRATKLEPDESTTDTYFISNGAELAYLSWIINMDVSPQVYNHSDVHYVLTNDIYLNETENWSTWDTTPPANNWTPIGFGNGSNHNTSFHANFDGRGYTIYGVYTNTTLTQRGLFGTVYGGTVRNTYVERSYIKGGNYVGGVAGYVQNSEYVESRIENCRYDGVVFGENIVGGIAGRLDSGSSITGCRNNAIVNGEGSTMGRVGGVAGVVQNNSFIKASYNRGGVSGVNDVGGIAGFVQANGSIENCYNTGNVTGIGSGTIMVTVGGIAGNVEFPAAVINCAALNRSVSANGGYPRAGRVLGRAYQNPTLGGNIAFSDMTVALDGVEKSFDNSLSSIDGFGLTAAQIRSDGTLSGLFTGDGNPWTCEDGGLPGVFGKTEPLPAHLRTGGETGVPNMEWYFATPSALGFYISTADELAGLAQLVNNGLAVFKGREITLTADIDLSVYGEDYNGGRGWTQIGNVTYPFNGFFDGGEHIITGLYINGSGNYAGLFGAVTWEGTIDSLGIEGADIKGGDYVGGIAGIFDGNMIKCYVTGKVEGGNYTGGILGQAHTLTSVTNCYSTASVKGDDYTGGIAGYIEIGKVTQSWASGTVEGLNFVGGIVGRSNSGKVTNCVALNQSVTGINNVGRVVGENNSGTLTADIAFDGMTDPGTGKFGDIIGEWYDKNGVNITAPQLQDSWGYSDILGTDAWTYKPYTLPGLFGNTVNMPAHLRLPGETGIPDISWYTANPSASAFYISTADELAGLAQLVNDATTDFLNKAIVLTDDINLHVYGEDYNDGAGWVPIGHSGYNPFRGIFEGDGHIITELYINSENYNHTGLFGRIQEGSTICTLGMENASIKGNDCVGGVVGYSSGSIKNCYVTGRVEGNNIVGGIAGNLGTYGVVTLCYTTAAIVGNIKVGGIVGNNNDGTVEICHALNPSITGNNDVARVAYTVNGTNSWNYAFEYMKDAGAGKFNAAVGANTNNGVSISPDMLQTEDGFPEHMTSPPWKYEPFRLPSFYGRTLDMPDYLKAVIPVFTTKDSGSGSLRYAVEIASPGTNIDCSEIANNTITLDSSILIDKNLIIDGYGVTLTRSGTSTQSMFLINSSEITVIMNRMRFNNITSNVSAVAGISTGATLNVNSCIFLNNTATVGNGGVFNVNINGILNVRGCTFINNKANSGGCIYITSPGASVNLTGNIFRKNKATLNGDIVYRDGGSVTSGGYNMYDEESFDFAFDNPNDQKNIALELDPSLRPIGNCDIMPDLSTLSDFPKTYFDGTARPEYAGGTPGAMGRSELAWGYTGFPNTDWYTVDPSATSYTISTADELAGLSELVYDGTDDFEGKTIELENDIDLSVYGENYGGGRGWLPIGFNAIDRFFGGTFDGGGFKITGLYINRPEINYIGLFGVIRFGEVKNLAIESADITGGDAVGGVVGEANGNARVTSCYVTGRVSGMKYIGGIAGTINGSIYHCYSTAEVSAPEGIAGGITGIVQLGSEVGYSWASGAVSVSYGANAGGIAGSCYGTVTTCAALNISVRASSYAGRVVGNGIGSWTSNIAFYDMGTDGGAAFPNEKTLTGRDGQSIIGSFIEANGTLGLSVFENPSIWTSEDGRLPGLFGQTVEIPTYLSKMPFGGAGTEIDPYIIKTAAQLARLAELVNGDSTDEFYAPFLWKNKHYRLDADIDLSSYGTSFNGGKGWIPIGGGTTATAFRGVFDGNNHKITNLYINTTETNNGLFGYITSTYNVIGTVKDLSVEVSITGGSNSGGIAGYISGNSSTQISKIVGCSVYGTVKADSYAGGIAGRVASNSTVSNCFSTASISVTGNGTGNNVGGIAGGVNVSDTSIIENCWSTGSVIGSQYVGGIAGNVGNNAIIRNSAALNVNVTGAVDVGRVMGVKGTANTMSNNIAFVDMDVTENGSPKSITSNLTGIDGLNQTAEAINLNTSFILSNRFTPANGWTLEDYRLPGLFGKTMAMPVHLRVDDVCYHDYASAEDCTICDDCDESNGGSHDFSGSWQTNATNHWKKCTDCTETAQSDSHSPNNQAAVNTNCTLDLKCDCGYVITAGNTSHTAVNQAAVNANCTNDLVCDCGTVMTAGNASHTLTDDIQISNPAYHDFKCTNCTVRGSWQQHSANNLSALDDDCTAELVCDCGYTWILNDNHSFSGGKQSQGESGHDFKCTDCTTRGGLTAHTATNQGAVNAVCTIDLECDCGYVMEEGNAKHTFTADCQNQGSSGHDFKCTDCTIRGGLTAHTAINQGEVNANCKLNLECVCSYVITAGNANHATHTSYNGNCNTAVACGNNDACTHVVLTAQTGHTGTAGDDCTVEVICTRNGCTKVAIAAQTGHIGTAGNDCTQAVACTRTSCTQTAIAASGGHNWDDGTPEGGKVCGDTADMIHNCTVTACIQTNTVVGELIEHTYGNWISSNNATCTADGTERRICSRSGCPTPIDSRTETGTMLEHTPKATDCTACDNCSATLGSHATHTSYNGNCNTAVACGNNGTCTNVVLAAQTGHTGTVGNDCTKAVQCTRNGCTEIAIAAQASHAGTPTNDCTQAVTCTRASCTQTAIAASGGHNWDDGTPESGKVCGDTADITYNCTVSTCTQENRVFGAVITHSYSAWVSDKNATCTADGTKTRVCTRTGCSDYDGEKSQTQPDTDSALGHKPKTSNCLECQSCAAVLERSCTVTPCGEHRLLEVIKVKEDDYIELRNNTDKNISTKGLYLTDENGELLKWQIPLMIIRPGGVLKVGGSDYSGGNLINNRMRTNFNMSGVTSVYLSNAIGDIVG